MSLLVNPRNRPPRQLEWGDRLLTDGPPSDGVPPSGLTSKTPGALTLHSFAGFGLQLTEIPESRTLYFTNRPYYPAGAFTHARLCVEVLAVSGGPVLMSGVAPGPQPRAYLEYAADGVTFSGAGDNSLSIEVSIGTPGTQRGGWVKLVSGARNDVAWQAVVDGGDGLGSSTIGDVEVEFADYVDPGLDKMYWRDLVPSDGPPTSGPYTEAVFERYIWSHTKQECGAFLWDICTPMSYGYESITPAMVMANVKVLSQVRATNDLGAGGFAPGNDTFTGHNNLGGPVGRFVGAPLKGGQRIESFASDSWFSAVAPSAYTDGTVALHIWLWRPGVGKLQVGTVTEYDPDGVPITYPVFAEGWQGGPVQKYVRYITRQCHVWGGVRGGFTTTANDRWVLDVYSACRVGCFCGDQCQGLGCWVNYNGTVEPTDNEGFADFFTGTASYTTMPTFQYLAAQ